MYERVERIKKRVVVDHYPICIEKLKITLDVTKEAKNDPVIIQRGKMLKATAERMPIAISDDELIVGIGASKPMGLEIDPHYGLWSDDEIASLIEDGFMMEPSDVEELRRLNSEHSPDTMIGRMGDIFYEPENERILSLLKAGLILPPWKDRSEGKGVGGGYCQSGLGLGPSLILLCVDYTKILHLGTEEMISQARSELGKLNYCRPEDLEKFRYYKAVILALEALNTLALRYSALAFEMAEKEADESRKKELVQIGETCAWIPAKPARTFREALQCFWFQFLMLSPSTTLPGGRFDQYMYPYYKSDLENGRITREEATELLCLLRLKDMELNRTSGKNNRKKNAGYAKWHNFIIGGCDKDGKEASNDLSYMMLDAALITRVPHHTITLRVSKDTPEDLMLKALECVKSGLSMPAFISEENYIRFFTSHGVPLEDARDFIITGCLDANLPGKSRTGPVPMTVETVIFDIFRHNGVDVKTGSKAGIETGDFTEFKSFEELLAALKKQLHYCWGIVAEKNNVELAITRELLPDPLRSALMFEGIESGTDTFRRRMPFDNAASVCTIGMVNVADSLAAIKKLCFNEKKYSLAELNEALDANWEGFSEMRNEFLNAPKYGNNDNFVDEILADLYAFFCEEMKCFPTATGDFHVPCGISITSHQPGGLLTGATPDGRKAGDLLADGSVSPMQGVDTRGPLAVLNSAMKIDQEPFQATLLNMKLSPDTIKSESDLRKLSSMIRTYLVNGGKHIQFNVVNQAELVDAVAHPEKHRDLIVRIAGYSAYFVQLNPQMQQEVINRTEHTLA